MEADHVDWIKARTACSINEVFEQLRERVKADVKSAQEIAAVDANFKTYPTDPFGTRFAVQITGIGIDRPVSARSFHLDDQQSHIAVRGADGGSIATITAESQGLDCQYTVAFAGDEARTEQRTELWELSRLILEPIFFPSA